MYSFSLAFQVFDNKDVLSLNLCSSKLSPYSLEWCNSVDLVDGSTCKVVIVTYRSECEWFAKSLLMSFSAAYEFLRNLPFPDQAIGSLFVTCDSSESSDDEQ